MLNVNYNSAVVPAYVLTNYSNFINEKQLLALMHLMALPDSRKQTWVTASERMGYTNFSSFERLLSDMAERKLVVIDNYRVDASPLWQACLANFSKPKVETPKPKSKPKTKTARHHAHALAYFLGIDKNEPGYQQQIGLLTKNIKNFGFDATQGFVAGYILGKPFTQYSPAGWVGAMLTLHHYNNIPVDVLIAAIDLYGVYSKQIKGKDKVVVQAIATVVIELGATDTNTYLGYCIDAIQKSKGLGWQLNPSQILASWEKWVGNGKPKTYQPRPTRTDVAASYN